MLAVAPITEILSEVYPAADAAEQDVRITVRATGPNKSEEEPPPLVRRSPELAHALSNLVENAVEFAENEVILHAVWSAAELRVRILDDGPGFASSIMGLVGEPYLTTRRSRFAADGQAVSLDRGQKGGMGLGIFIAKDLLERTGAQVSFANRKSGGAAVTIAWPRPMIEVLSIDETNISDLVGAGN
jgi:two-component system sensor histidine kinase RegB